MWGDFERERHKSDGVFVQPPEQRGTKGVLNANVALKNLSNLESIA